MNAFRTYWNCALESDSTLNTSAEGVWRAALGWTLRQRSANGLCEDCGCDISSKVIKKELGDTNE